MISRKQCYIFIISSLTLLLSACGGSSSSSGTPGTATTQGVFLDSAVNGMQYQTATQSGTTDSNGTFNYIAGETVTFHIGDIVIGTAMGASTLTPVSLVPGAVDETHPTVVNITRFLLTLDDDNDPNNGVTISSTVTSAATGMSIDFHKSVADFESATDLVTAITALTASTTLISSAAAQSHLQSTILTAYAGSYSGTYSGDDSGRWQVSVSSDGTLSGTGNDNFGGSFSIIGSFTSSGQATLTQGGTSSGATFTGTVGFDGALTGTWSGMNNTRGTFAGSKQ